jgi:hypothetical protein
VTNTLRNKYVEELIIEAVERKEREQARKRSHELPREQASLSTKKRNP